MPRVTSRAIVVAVVRWACGAGFFGSCCCVFDGADGGRDDDGLGRSVGCLLAGWAVGYSRGTGCDG